MKKFRINGDKEDIRCEQVDGLATTERMFEITGEDIQCSDGYHTFDELYDHRITLFIALCKMNERAFRHYGVQHEGMPPWRNPVWRSHLHSDGSSFDGWFILGIHDEAGKQITYHLPVDRWDECDFAETRDRAPEWDGHTAADVLDRLKLI